MFKHYKIASHEAALVFRNGEFRLLLETGRHWLWTAFNKTCVRIVSKRDPWLIDAQLDLIVKSGALEGRAVAVELEGSRAGVGLD